VETEVNEKRPETVGELRESGYRVRPVREEMRGNLIRKIRNKETLFPSVIGFEDTVIPYVENAILSGQDIIFLGERGQAKSRLIRQLVSLLDDAMPAVAGCEINDNPFAPICRGCQDRAEREGDELAIAWLTPEQRYGEKLATPDITIADLIGEIDPIKVAEGRYLSDEMTIHYGLVPRSNRGIFSINELPDLAERIQVGLLNIMEERDIQIRGYRVRMPLDVYVVASANPEDYTNRGRIITPLKDRYGAQIRTHYPRTVEDEIGIMEQEMYRGQDDGRETFVPQYMKEIVAEITRLARRSPDINQRSGVSVRTSITGYESVLANALRRAVRLNEGAVAPRISDLPYLLPAISGKIEFETLEEGKEGQIIEKLIAGAVLTVFNRHFSLSDLDEVVTSFKSGVVADASDMAPSESYLPLLTSIGGLQRAVGRLKTGEQPAVVASAVEFVLEGLHLNKRLNKEKVSGRAQYRG
jgi:magnesium chelatase subunit I